MKHTLFFVVLLIFMGCSKEDHENDGAIMGVWNLTREIVVESEDADDGVRTKEVLHSAQEIIYEFKKDNQLLIKREGRPSLLMRYNCYNDLNIDYENAHHSIQEFLDINEITFMLSYSEGKLILDASPRNGPILYFERS